VPQLAPSGDAPAAVVEVFREILAATPAEHFVPADAPLIQAYAEAIVLARQAAVELVRDGPVIAGRTSPWIVVQEKAHRAIAALSARLRLSPQHRSDSRGAGRKSGGARPSVYQVMEQDGDDLAF
jgi:predicted metal-binding membrane protein